MTTPMVIELLLKQSEALRKYTAGIENGQLKSDSNFISHMRGVRSLSHVY